MTKVQIEVEIETLKSQIAFEENWNEERLAQIAEYEAKSREYEAQFNERLADGKSLTALELAAQCIDNCVRRCIHKKIWYNTIIMREKYSTDLTAMGNNCSAF